MQLNRAKLIYALSKVSNPSIIKKRSWDTLYNNKPCTYWNNLLWKKILEHDTIFGEAINKYEFYNFCGYYCNNEKSKQIFNSINTKSRSISFLEFEEYLEKLDFYDYNEIMKSLEFEVLELENVKLKSEFVEIKIDKPDEDKKKFIYEKIETNFFQKLYNKICNFLINYIKL